MPPRIDSPYPRYPTGNRPVGSTAYNPALYQSLLSKTMSESQRVVPSSQFSTPYNFDPILSRINAMSSMTLANAKAEAAALRKKALIESGAEDIAGDINADANTIEAARQNPFSGTKTLQRDYTQRINDLDLAMNTGNLFFSGERVRRLEDTERGRAQAQSLFSSQLRDALSHIQTQVLAAEERARQEALMQELADLFRSGPPGGYPTPAPPAQPPATTEPPVVYDPTVETPVEQWPQWAQGKIPHLFYPKY